MKTRMITLLCLVYLFAIVGFGGGCASTSSSSPTSDTSQSSSQPKKKKKNNQENVTSMPWNTPPSWQQNGQAGSYMGGMPGAGY
ncbi:hypothetical protein EM20IM_00820 [Candidatus Methylacidiphilum infernorum]|uniref:Uncharacterized protein n=1 Tax=Candidatus Methylacidiphilum infernorum TaxID=511746 RepID=A0ABX7PWI1_9BACT|nr:hypothetical protein [Candidatus Methylacidiphilum infernorum]QSR86949.1 hypothetical protein EM20IM_00820 [Candidatus Methylacidiphilum infernorum]